MYIGSTNDSVGRFNKHLIAKDTCVGLRAALAMYGLSKFKVYIFEYVTFPPYANSDERQAMLRIAEQRYIDMYPTKQLFNAINAVAKR
jgi:hypothetical protein